MTKYSKQQKVEKRTRKIKTNENETDARATLKRAQKRRPIAYSEYTMRTYKNTYSVCPYTHTHQPGMLGKARAHEGNKLTSTRKNANSENEMHYNLSLCMYLCVLRLFWKNTACL